MARIANDLCRAELPSYFLPNCRYKDLRGEISGLAELLKILEGQMAAI